MGGENDAKRINREKLIKKKSEIHDKQSTILKTTGVPIVWETPNVKLHRF